MAVRSSYNNLREKLDLMGYKQLLPLEAVPLVAALFEDLIKTTESLRDSKQQIIELLEEKSCWELGVEPYKCDNSRLLTQCNQLHMQVIKQREEFDEKLNDLNAKIRDLQTDKLYFQQQCEQLEKQLKESQNSTYTAAGGNAKCSASSGIITTSSVTLKSKKPFITTVKCGDVWPPLPPLPLKDVNANTASNVAGAHGQDHKKCSKCCACYSQRATDGMTQNQSQNQKKCLEEDLMKLVNTNRELNNHIKFYEQKIEARDREILRLNDLLSGGRSPASLARECCYKDIEGLTEDLNILQREKVQSLTRLREYQDQMHQTMQKAMHLEKCNCRLQKQLEELKEAALSVEAQANAEIMEKENEVEQLKQQLKQMQNKLKSNYDKNKQTDVKGKKDREQLEKDRVFEGKMSSAQMDKHRINEKLNELMQKESEMKFENERLQKKLIKLKNKLQASQKELQDLEHRQGQHIDEEKIRLKSERDFFQKEYLRLLGKVGSEKEVEFLQTQIQSKDEELRLLRTELCSKQQVQALVPVQCVQSKGDLQHIPISLPSSARSTASGASDCIQAAILRIERERDCARNDLQRIRCERDTLREKLLCTTKMYDEQMEKAQRRYNELNCRLQNAERENRELNSARQPAETQIIMLKEDLDVLKQTNYQLKEDNNKYLQQYNQLKILHEQTEKYFTDNQKKLLLCEKQLEIANTKLDALDSKSETSKRENQELHAEVSALKQTYITLECEKDKLLMELDAKTEETCQLECELKTYKEERNLFEKKVHQLEEQLLKLQSQTRARDTELHETSTKTKNLRSQLSAVTVSRDEAIEENARLSNDLADLQAETQRLKKVLKESEIEIESLKAQLRQYVQEVKKAEDLLLQKEKDREEILEHFRNLSQDAVMLEGTNQTLENTAAEKTRQINDLEEEIDSLKKELCCRNAHMNDFENKMADFQARITCLEHQLEESHENQCLLKTDLAAHKELCDKLDNEKGKLNDELQEVNRIKKNVEEENEALRQDLEKIEKHKRISLETLEELLSKTRNDLEQQIKADNKLSHDLMQFKRKNDELLKELEMERQKRRHHETLAREYQVQNQELRHNLTDEHFRQARSRQHCPHHDYTRTL